MSVFEAVFDLRLNTIAKARVYDRTDVNDTAVELDATASSTLGLDRDGTAGDFLWIEFVSANERVNAKNVHADDSHDRLSGVDPLVLFAQHVVHDASEGSQNLLTLNSFFGRLHPALMNIGGHLGDSQIELTAIDL